MAARTHALSRTLESHRSEIITETALVLGCYGLFIYLADGFLPAIPSGDRILHLAISILLVFGVSTILLAGGIFATKAIQERRLARDTTASPGILDALVRIAGGEKDFREICPLYERYPRAVEAAFVDALGAQKGSSLTRLAAAADACGIPARWRMLTDSASPHVRCAAIIGLGLLPKPESDAEFRKALHDSEELVVAEAARALIRSGRLEVLEELLLDLPTQTRLDRALLAEWLRKYSVPLTSNAIPAMLRSDDRVTILTGLEVLASWRRALLVPDIKPLLRHPDTAICAASWKVAPYALGLQIGSEEYDHALHSADGGVRAACLNTIAQMRIASAVGHAERAILDPETQVARAAAYAMALLGRRKELERVATSGIAPASACATEALEKLMIGRLEQ